MPYHSGIILNSFYNQNYSSIMNTCLDTYDGSEGQETFKDDVGSGSRGLIRDWVLWLQFLCLINDSKVGSHDDNWSCKLE